MQRRGPTSPLKLGIIEQILTGADDLEKFRDAAKLGVAGVEILLGHDRLQDRERLRRLKKAQDATGLLIPSLVLLDSTPISRDAGGAPAALIQDLRATVAWAEELRAGVILMTPGLAAQVPTNADLDRVVGGFREICPLAETKGVTLCYGGALPATQLRRMEKAIASEAFGYSLDVADTAWRGLDTATEIRALGKLIAQVRMKETRSTPGDCRPGLGRVNYAESAKALDEIGYQGWLVMGTPVGPAELVRRDISFTRAVFSNLAPAGPWPLLGAFSWDFPRGALDRLISEFKRCGLRSVQLAGGLLDEALEDPAFASLLAVKLEQNGIRIAGLAGYRNMVAPDPEKRRMHLDYLKRCLEIAPRLGTSVVASETGTFHPESDWKDAPENSSEQAWNRLYQALDQLLPVAEKHGSILALEGYVANVLKTASQLLGLLERFPTEHLQVVLDPFNYLSKELLPVRERITREFLDQFEPRFVLAHLKDVSADGAEVSTPEFGQGVFSYQPYFDFLRARRPDLPIILEHLAFDRMPAAIQRFQAMNID